MNHAHSILFIHGAGGHAKSIADAADFNSIFFIDPFVCPKKNFSKGSLISSLPLIDENHAHLVGIGDNQKRAEIFAQLQQQHLPIITIIASSAIVSEQAFIDIGCFIGHSTYIATDTHIQNNCIINTGAIIEHDVKIGTHTHIAIGACIAGSATIGSFCFIGAGAIIIDGVHLCDHVTVGAGAVVVESITEPGIYVGVPAKKIK